MVASKSGNEVKLLDDTGNMKSLTVSYPIIDAEVAEQGVIALMLQEMTETILSFMMQHRKSWSALKRLQRRMVIRWILMYHRMDRIWWSAILLLMELRRRAGLLFTILEMREKKRRPSGCRI